MLKKIIFVVAGLAVVMLLAIVVRRPSQGELTGQPERAPVRPSAPAQAVSSLPAEETPLKPEAKVYQPDYDQLVIKKYVQEFSLPQQLAQELLEAAQEVQPAGEIEPITKAEQTKLITIARRNSVRRHGNIVAGYQVSDQEFEQIVSAALPDQGEEEASPSEDATQAQPSIELETSLVEGPAAESATDVAGGEAINQPEDIGPGQPSAEPETPLAEGPAASENAPEVAEDEEELLRSEALATLGLLAMLELNYAQAETAFRSLIEHYPDSEAAPMVRLELARLISEQGRVEEALSLVNEALQLHGDDSGYCQIAEELERVIIEGNE